MGLRPTWRYRIYGPLAVLAVLSVPPLWDVAGWWVLAGVAAAGVLVGLAFLSDFCRALAEVLGAILMPLLCLLGFNELWHWVLGGHLRPSLELGLILAGLVFAVAAGGYLLAWG